ncbi:hypothetical protein K9M79_02805 [Candidatus Woesearchaeota archaeon]|nr:hypothetical protein [Candidatus Woesearchaeota archaeon]
MEKIIENRLRNIEKSLNEINKKVSNLEKYFRESINYLCANAQLTKQVVNNTQASTKLLQEIKNGNSRFELSRECSGGNPDEGLEPIQPTTSV